MGKPFWLKWFSLKIYVCGPLRLDPLPETRLYKMGNTRRARRILRPNFEQIAERVVRLEHQLCWMLWQASAADQPKEGSEWCDDVSTSKGFEIKMANAQKEKLEATIDQLNSCMHAWIRVRLDARAPKVHEEICLHHSIRSD